MDHQSLRYSCQISLPGFGERAQLLLQQARVLIVGAGGLGCPASQYLTAAGVGVVGIADFDTVSISNLHRQILYSAEDVGKKKAIVACQKLQKQNAAVNLKALDVKITSYNVMDIIAHYDIVVDGTDNFETRYLLNDACVLADKPIVYGAIYQYEGQVAVWNVGVKAGQRSPNYRDLFPQVDASQIPNCAEGGVIPTLAGIIGCMQANEVIKYITNTGDLLSGKVLVFDAQTMQSRIIKIGETSKSNIKSLTETLDIPTISVSQLKEGLKHGSLTMIDIRTIEERDAYDIGGIHFALDKIYSYIEKSDINSEIVLYCASGKRSAEAVKVIRSKFPGVKVSSLAGGLKAWQESL